MNILPWWIAIMNCEKKTHPKKRQYVRKLSSHYLLCSNVNIGLETLICNHPAHEIVLFPRVSGFWRWKPPTTYRKQFRIFIHLLFTFLPETCHIYVKCSRCIAFCIETYCFPYCSYKHWTLILVSPVQRTATNYKQLGILLIYLSSYHKPYTRDMNIARMEYAKNIFMGTKHLPLMGTKRDW